MNRLNEFKKEYNIINAPTKLKSDIKEIIRKKKKQAVIKKYAIIAASLVFIFISTLNLSPSMAYAGLKIPILREIIQVVTFGRYEVKDKGYEIKVIIPELQGLIDERLQDELNASFKENADIIIKDFENDMAELKKEFGEEIVHMGVEYNYYIKTDNEDILALDVYFFNYAGSSSTIHAFYTIDKKKGEILTLESLFKKEEDYISVLSQYILQEMERLNKDEEGFFWIDDNSPFGFKFERIKPNQNFYINNNGDLVICFDKYEVAAGAQGSPEFIIPKDIIEKVKK